MASAPRSAQRLPSARDEGAVRSSIPLQRRGSSSSSEITTCASRSSTSSTKTFRDRTAGREQTRRGEKRQSVSSHWRQRGCGGRKSCSGGRDRSRLPDGGGPVVCAAVGARRSDVLLLLPRLP